MHHNNKELNLIANINSIFFLDLGLVECSITIDCLGPTLGTMTIKKCCVGKREGLAYTSSGSDVCHTCIGM